MDPHPSLEPAPDPRPRLAAYLVLIAGVMFALTSIAAITVALAFTLLVHALAGRPVAELARDGRRLWVFVVVVVALNGLTAPGEVALSIGGRADVTWPGLAAGVFFSIRLAVLYLATALLVRTTGPEEMAAGLFAAVRPLSRPLANRLAFHGFMTMGFVPLFAAEMERVRIAQSFRGGSLSGRPLDRVRAARLLVVPLVLSAVHRSSQLAMVSELRGLQDRLGGLLLVRAPQAQDFLLPVATLAVVVAAAVVLG
jgi:energy-coupling factor transport system permease protein